MSVFHILVQGGERVKVLPLSTAATCVRVSATDARLVLAEGTVECRFGEADGARGLSTAACAAPS